jgi:hypothetical protein
MSVRDSSKLIAAYTVDFSTSTLTTAYTTAITFIGGATALSANTKGVYIENTSGTPVAIAYGASGSPTLADLSPINGLVEKSLVLSATMQIFLKSQGAASITTGKFTICFYN